MYKAPMPQTPDDVRRLRRWAQMETESRVSADDPDFAGLPIVVMMGYGSITMRAKGSRRKFTVPINVVFDLARRWDEEPFFAVQAQDPPSMP